MDIFKELRPSENLTLWRFMDLFKFIDLILSSEITLVNSTLMKDPFEGVLHKDIHFEYVDLDGNSKKIDNTDSLPKILKDISRKKIFFSCWHYNEFESAGMWDIYGNQNGIAIKTNVSKLKNSIQFDKCKDMDLLSVNYYTGSADYFIPNRPESHIYTSILNKRKSFEHEKEVRLIWVPMDNNKSQIRKIKVDLKNLIDVIYVSPLFENWQLDTIKQFLKKVNLDITVEKSKLYDLK
jgi:hypothetical protein